MTISFTAVILTCDYENAQIRLSFSGWTKAQPYVEDPRSEAQGSGGQSIPQKFIYVSLAAGPRPSRTEGACSLR